MPNIPSSITIASNMQVFFSCGTRNLDQRLAFYKVITQTIEQQNHTLTREWLDDALKAIQSGNRRSPSKIYREVMSSIQKADLCIFDVSEQAMSVGHQMTYSLEKGKPTLLVMLDQGFSPNDLFITGSASGYLKTKTYQTKEELERIVKNFIRKEGENAKVRINLSLDKYLMQHVEDVAYQTGESKTNVLKDLIQKDIEAKQEAS